MPQPKKVKPKPKSNQPVGHARTLIRRLRARIKRLEAQRDYYWQVITKLLPPMPDEPTREELRAMEKVRPTLSDYVAQLQAELNGDA